MITLDLPIRPLAVLWEAARAMYAAATQRLESTRRIRPDDPQADRKERRLWIEPVETLLRCLLRARAYAFLADTEDGRRMMADGAANPLQPPARIRRDQAIARGEAQAAAHPASGHAAPPADDADPAAGAAPDTMADTMADRRDDAPIAITEADIDFALIKWLRPGLTWEEAQRLLAHRKAAREAAARAAQARCAANARRGPRRRRHSREARRLEAIRRVLADPQLYVRRMAWIIARALPEGWLQEKRIILVNRSRWMQGNVECAEASWHAAEAYERLTGQDTFPPDLARPAHEEVHGPPEPPPEAGPEASPESLPESPPKTLDDS